MSRSGFAQDNLSPIAESPALTKPAPTPTPSRKRAVSSRASSVSPAPSHAMSTRRTVRGTSKGPSEVSAGASVVTGATTTPRRRPRQTGPLPAVGTKTSNSYGTNAVQASVRASGPLVADQITGVLDDLLDAGMSSQQNTSFGNESGIFGRAHVASSVVSGLSQIEEEQDSPPAQTGSNPAVAKTGSTPATRASRTQSDALRQTSRNIRVGRPEAAPRSFIENVKRGKEFVFASLHLHSKWIKLLLSALVALLLLSVVAARLPQLHFYGFSPSAMRHNVGQLYSSGDLGSLESRVAKVEADVFQLQRKGKMHDETVKRLQTMLPDFIVGTKDKSGRIILPNGLWQAIDSKIQSEHPLAFNNIQGGTASSHHVKNQVDKEFDRFIKSNEFKSKTIDSRFSHLIDEAHNNNVVISKSDAINLIRESWEDNQSGVNSEMSKLRKDLQQVTQAISKLEEGPQSKEDVQAIAKDVFAKMLPNAQLNALSKANLHANINYGLTRVNHFSKGTGAVINTMNISPNFVFPQMKHNFAHKLFLSAIQNPVPTPKGPVEALQKWEEHGDCWCSPADNAKGFGPSLAVIMGSNIHPEEVVIEHIKSSAAIEPGSAPKELELLAFVPDFNEYNRIKQASYELFPEEADSIDRLPHRYVRIATFMYDVNGSDNVQAFPVQIDTKLYNAHTNKLIVRAKSNWGSVPYTCLYRVRVHGAIVHTPGIY